MNDHRGPYTECIARLCAERWFILRTAAERIVALLAFFDAWYYRTRMLSMKALMRFLDRGFLIRSLMIVMLYSLIPFGECFLLLTLDDYLGSYMILAIVASTALLGLLLIFRPLFAALRAVHDSIDEGYYPEEPFAMLAGTLFSAILLLTPGLATDVVGLLLLVPLFRRAVGRVVTRRMEGRLKELYEYIKLYER